MSLVKHLRLRPQAKATNTTLQLPHSPFAFLLSVTINAGANTEASGKGPSLSHRHSIQSRSRQVAECCEADLVMIHTRAHVRATICLGEEIRWRQAMQELQT